MKNNKSNIFLLVAFFCAATAASSVNADELVSIKTANIQERNVVKGTDNANKNSGNAKERGIRTGTIRW